MNLKIPASEEKLYSLKTCMVSASAQKQQREIKACLVVQRTGECKGLQVSLGRQHLRLRTICPIQVASECKFLFKGLDHSRSNKLSKLTNQDSFPEQGSTLKRNFQKLNQDGTGEERRQGPIKEHKKNNINQIQKKPDIGEKISGKH